MLIYYVCIVHVIPSDNQNKQQMRKETKVKDTSEQI